MGIGHMVTEVKKSHSLLSECWRARRADVKF